MKTLFNITELEAAVLLEAHNDDPGLLAITLWNKGRASSIEDGLHKAQLLAEFARTA